MTRGFKDSLQEWTDEEVQEFLRVDDERKSIVKRYQEGPDQADIPDWENPNLEEFTATDRYGFLHTPEEMRLIAKRDDKLKEAESKRTDKWLKMDRRWEEKYCPSIDRPSEKLMQRIYKGIPESWRGRIWARFLRVDDSKGSNPDRYQEMSARGRQTSPYVHQIDLDVNRTFRSHIHYKQRYGVLQASLFNVLAAYSVYDTELGYTQGMNEIAALLLLYMSEEEAFWAFCTLMNGTKHGMHGFYKEGFPKLHRFVTHTEGRVVHKFLPKLSHHLQKQRVEMLIYATSWFLQCFIRTLEMPLVLRVWDIFVVEGERLLVAMTYNLLRMSQSRLLRMGFEASFQFLQHGLRGGGLDYDDDAVVDSLRDCLEKLRRSKLDQPPPVRRVSTAAAATTRRSTGSVEPSGGRRAGTKGKSREVKVPSEQLVLETNGPNPELPTLPFGIRKYHTRDEVLRYHTSADGPGRRATHQSPPLGDGGTGQTRPPIQVHSAGQQKESHVVLRTPPPAGVASPPSGSSRLSPDGQNYNFSNNVAAAEASRTVAASGEMGRSESYYDNHPSPVTSSHDSASALQHRHSQQQQQPSRLQAVGIGEVVGSTHTGTVPGLTAVNGSIPDGDPSSSRGEVWYQRAISPHSGYRIKVSVNQEYASSHASTTTAVTTTSARTGGGGRVRIYTDNSVSPRSRDLEAAAPAPPAAAASGGQDLSYSLTSGLTDTELERAAMDSSMSSTASRTSSYLETDIVGDSGDGRYESVITDNRRRKRPPSSGGGGGEGGTPAARPGRQAPVAVLFERSLLADDRGSMDTIVPDSEHDALPNHHRLPEQHGASLMTHSYDEPHMRHPFGVPSGVTVRVSPTPQPVGVLSSSRPFVSHGLGRKPVALQ